MTDALETIISRLEQTAADLRAGDLTPDRAAVLVDEMARVASQAGGELDRRVRAGDQPLGLSGQLALGS